nr:pyruvate formate-lyase-activating protein [uncultured Solibaculum sp.]
MTDLDITGRIHSRETFGALDGPGIRYVLFLQGCPMRCLYCHNPDSWRPLEGQEVTVGEMVQDVLRYRNFMTGGITLSGGEPLAQPLFTAALLKQCHRHGIHAAIDTAGSIPLSCCQEAVDEGDLLLLDIKALDPDDHKLITGRGNASTLELLDYREANHKPVWIRHVLVPGYTLDSKKLQSLARFLSHYTCIQKVELLPFHKMGEYKWEQMKLPYRLTDTPVPTADQVAAAKEIFISFGLPL